MEISTEPLVREYVRTFYSKNALVTTRPTPVGIDAIDAFHQFEGVKWINGKLVGAFDDEQWLLIQKAEEEKLIDVTVGLSKESIDTVLFDFEQLFSSDGLSRTSPTWNEQRKQILQEAIVALLLPIMEKESRMNLVVRAKRVLLAKCGLQLWNKVSVAPPNAGNLDCRCVNLFIILRTIIFCLYLAKHSDCA
jgi:transcription elongation factor SPT6